MTAATLAIYLPIVGCSPSASPRPPDKLFVGCAAPLTIAGGRTITTFLHVEDRKGRLLSLYFEVVDPNAAPAIDGDTASSYHAYPISDTGAELVRGNVREPGKPSYYHGMDETDQMSMHLAVFGTRAIQFDNRVGYGKLFKPDILPTGDLLFLEPGWAIGEIVGKEKIALALAYKASASAALNALRLIRGGCSLPPKKQQEAGSAGHRTG